MVNLEAPGDPIPDSKIKQDLHRRIQKLFEENLSEGTYNPRKFPGSHPVSLSRDHLRPEIDYLICEKSDGVRYLLYLPAIQNIRGVNECQAFLIDRKMTFWKIVLMVPAALLRGDSIFDVELVLDHGTNLRLLIFDTLFASGVCFMHNNYYERLQTAWFSFVYPVREANKASKRAMEVYLKDFFRSSQVDYVWNHIRPLLPHQCDGLIFTAVSSEYVIGANQGILKWKPAQLNTLDFSVKSTDRGVYELYTQGRVLEKFAEMSDRESEGLVDGSIVECYLSEDKWKIYKIRSDKNSPNATDTAISIVKSIKDNVEIEEIIQFFQSAKKSRNE
jgi:hypothetical protein